MAFEFGFRGVLVAFGAFRVVCGEAGGRASRTLEISQKDFRDFPQRPRGGCRLPRPLGLSVRHFKCYPDIRTAGKSSRFPENSRYV